MSQTLEVNGQPARVLDGTVPKPPEPMLETPVDELLRGLARHQAKINEAAVRHSKTGNALKTLKETREKMYEELTARGVKLDEIYQLDMHDRLRSAAELDAIDEDEEDDEG